MGGEKEASERRSEAAWQHAAEPVCGHVLCAPARQRPRSIAREFLTQDHPSHSGLPLFLHLPVGLTGMCESLLTTRGRVLPRLSRLALECHIEARSGQSQRAMITHRSPTDELHTYDQYRKRAVDKVGYQVEQNRTDSLENGRTAQERPSFNWLSCLRFPRRSVRDRRSRVTVKGLSSTRIGTCSPKRNERGITFDQSAPHPRGGCIVNTFNTHEILPFK